MKLVSFRIQTPVGNFVRSGALHGDAIVDLNMAYTSLLASRKEAKPGRLADARVPAMMLELLEGGLGAMTAAREGFQYAIDAGDALRGPQGVVPEQQRASDRPIAESDVAA